MAPSVLSTPSLRGNVSNLNKRRRKKGDRTPRVYSSQQTNVESADIIGSSDEDIHLDTKLGTKEEYEGPIGTDTSKQKGKKRARKRENGKGKPYQMNENDQVGHDAETSGAETCTRQEDNKVDRFIHGSEGNTTRPDSQRYAKIKVPMTTTRREEEVAHVINTQGEARKERVEERKSQALQLENKLCPEPISREEDERVDTAVCLSELEQPGLGTLEGLQQDVSIVGEKPRRDSASEDKQDTPQLKFKNKPESDVPARANGSNDAKREKPASGVIYISRIPPRMDVSAVRALLSKVGQLGRVWLRPESAEARKERRALGSTRRREEFRDGWVEFVKRSDAKRAARLLNGQPMAGALRPGRWANDLWCMRLLKGYTWRDLVEETCGGGRERTLKVKAEVAAARRERNFVEERVAMARKMRKGGGDREGVRRFRQKRSIEVREWEEDVDERRAREAMKRVDEEVENGKARDIDAELVGMLFKKRKKE